jgi:hypothetical protein
MTPTMTTAEKNARFAAMSPAEKRVAIAHDVIEQLRLEKIYATQGTYLNAPAGNAVLESNAAETFGSAACQACAIGSLLACAIGAQDSVTLSDVNAIVGLRSIEMAGSDAFRYLERYFDKEQMVMIETAFEGDLISDDVFEISRQSEHECVDFHDYYRDEDGVDETRLLTAIMQNIINNNGTFVP